MHQLNTIPLHNTNPLLNTIPLQLINPQLKPLINPRLNKPPINLRLIPPMITNLSIIKSPNTNINQSLDTNTNQYPHLPLVLLTWTIF
jgi:hypothetical protein